MVKRWLRGPGCYTYIYMFSNATFSDLFILFISILIAMSVHEAMHAYIGHALGDTTAQEQGRLTLNPLKHIDIITTVLLPLILILLHLPPIFAAKPVPFNPSRVKFEEFGAALIALAGPFTNLILAVITALVLKALPDVSYSLFHVLALFIEVNIGLFVFNMIPFPPLDGSRLLYALAPEPVQNIMATIEGFGFTAILIFMFLLFPILSPVISNIYIGIYNFLLAM
jgi:Zn-dependent protease